MVESALYELLRYGIRYHEQVSETVTVPQCVWSHSQCVLVLYIDQVV